MFKRKQLKKIIKWAQKPKRKPLLLRGARQVGKTSLVEVLAKDHFENAIMLNLDRDDHLSLIESAKNIEELIQVVELHFAQSIETGKTLLFIDEVQNSEKAMKYLRFFYEDIPDLHVIAAGSLLELKLAEKSFTIPVGRVEYQFLHPVTFSEFLMAIGEDKLHDYIKEITRQSSIPETIHNRLLDLYEQYSIVGGMPEAVAIYQSTQKLSEVMAVHESILQGFEDDVYKYATSSQARYVNYVFNEAPKAAGSRITYEKFAGSHYKSREMRQAFDTLEKAQIIRRLQATSSQKAPLFYAKKKAPKLFFLDAGLVNYKLGIQEEILQSKWINSHYQGNIMEQLLGQALVAIDDTNIKEIGYWFRNKTGSSAEVDFLMQYKTQLLPIEVKYGKAGRLRSIHQFLLESGQDTAFRVYTGPLKVEQHPLNQERDYTLVSIPIYLSDYFLNLI